MPSKQKSFFQNSTTPDHAGKLSGRENILALAPIDSGAKLAAIEHTTRFDNVVDGYLVNIYDLTRDGALVRSLTVNKGIRVHPVMDVVRDPDTLVLVVEELDKLFVQVVNLATMQREKEPIPIPKAGWFSGSEYRTPFTIETLDGGRNAVLHDGQSNEKGHRLLSFDLFAGRQRCKPVDTWGSTWEEITGRGTAYPSGAESFGSGVENRAGIAVERQGCFVIGTIMGEVQKRSVHDLALVDKWQLRVPDWMGDEQWPNCQIFSLAATADGKRLAVGTAGGSVHILDLNDGSELVDPMVPASYYGERRSNVPVERQRPSEVVHLSYFGDDQLLATAHADGSIRVWNSLTATQVGREDNSTTRCFETRDCMFVAPDLSLFWHSRAYRSHGRLDLKSFISQAQDRPAFQAQERPSFQPRTPAAKNAPPPVDGQYRRESTGAQSARPQPQEASDHLTRARAFFAKHFEPATGAYNNSSVRIRLFEWLEGEFLVERAGQDYRAILHAWKGMVHSDKAADLPLTRKEADEVFKYFYPLLEAELATLR